MNGNFLAKYGSFVTGKYGRWVVVLLWVAAILFLSLIFPQANSEKNEGAPQFLEETGSQRAKVVMEKEFGGNPGIPALITWYNSEGLTDNDLTSIQLLSRDISTKLDPLATVPPLQELPLQALRKQLSEDGTTFILPVHFDEGLESKSLKEGLGQIRKSAISIFEHDPFSAPIDKNGSLLARVTGPAGILVDATDLFSQGDLSLLIGTVCIVLFFLLIIYRSPILALVPLVGVGMAYMVISPILGFLGREGFIDFDSQSISIMTVLLFGAGTDYCLFFITQFRENLKADENKFKAIKRAFTGSSGAIFMSGLTVVVSLLVLLFAKYGSVHRFAIPFSLAIFIMMLASLSLIPALLSILGRFSFYPFVPRTERMIENLVAKRAKPYRIKTKKKSISLYIGEVVSKNPWKTMLTSALILGILALFSMKIEYTYDTLASFPEDMPSREGYRIISEHFNPGELAPLRIIIKSDVTEEVWKAKLNDLPYVANVSGVTKGEKNEQFTKLDVELTVNPYSNEAMSYIPKIQEDIRSFLVQNGEKRGNAEVWVGGITAEQYDTSKMTNSDSNIIIPIVIGLIGLLLLLYLHSITATLYLLGTVLLSYFGSLGLGWIILHYGFGVEAIQGFIPLYAFVFIVALGEDYNIFMISSIWKKSKEMKLVDAIKEGVAQTGGVITSAGLILAATFAVLTTLPIQVLVHFGTITAIGVLLDTLLVRPFLVPSITAALGKWAFWPAKGKMKNIEFQEKVMNHDVDTSGKM